MPSLRLEQNGQGEPCYYMAYDSWGDMLDFLCDTSKVTYKGHGGTSGQERGSYVQTDSDWIGTPNWKTCENLMREGWAEGERRVAKLSKNLEVRCISKIVREDTNYDVEGAMFDV